MAHRSLAIVSNSKLFFLCLCLATVLSFTRETGAATHDYFTIRVVDDQTGRGVPLAELRTVNKVAWWTDSNGIVAFNEPGLMDMDVFFHASSPGYAYAKDLFDFRGVKLKPTVAGSATIKLKRLNIAERLYRITGQGIYRDSVLAGQPVPLQQPLLNGRVMGQDSVLATPYHGKIYWFWGDTDQPSFPLGNFGASGATSEWPGRGGLDPAAGVDLTYFANEAGFSKPMCQLPGPGAHWIQSLLTLPDDHGGERLVAHVANHTNVGAAQSWDLLIFNDEKRVFEPLQHWDVREGADCFHSFRGFADGVDYFYLFPNWRVQADLKSLRDLASYEALTCVAGRGKIQGQKTQLDRDSKGKPHYTWKAGADRLSPDRVRELIAADRLKPEESWIDLHDFETGARVPAGRGSVYWNHFRRRWIMLISHRFTVGEIWFAEADTPVGPWAYARRVLTHGDYNFYNPVQHPFFDQDGGRLIYFEGTYSDFLSGARVQMPRYDYNQLMYRLALDDPRLALPVAVYRLRGTNHTMLLRVREQVEVAEIWKRIEDVAWFALPPHSRGHGLVPIYAMEKEETTLSLTPPSGSTAQPLFHGLSLVEPELGRTLSGEWEFQAQMPDGGELKFLLEISAQGENVKVHSPDGNVTGEGTFRNGKLELTLKTEKDSYRLHGAFKGRTLAGNWSQAGDLRKMNWTASQPATAFPEHRSAALVVLKEYRKLTGEGRCYSTELTAPPGFKPEGRPLCRVWKAPSAIMVADWTIRPSGSEPGVSSSSSAR
jgi:hypothetical protein